MDSLDLKRQIKQWEHDFRRVHGRRPEKSDIKKDASTYQLYKSYNALKSAGRDKSSGEDHRRGKRAGGGASGGHGSTERQRSATEEEEYTESSAAAVTDTEVRLTAELGPTPQANGKVLSIFDMKLVSMTPPESSPLKGKQAAAGRRSSEVAAASAPADGGVGSGAAAAAVSSESVFRTPTRNSVKRIDFLQAGTAGGARASPTGARASARKTSSLLSKLAEADAAESSQRGDATPTRAQARVGSSGVMDTPLYISKHNRKFDFSSPQRDEGPGSPVRGGSDSGSPRRRAATTRTWEPPLPLGSSPVPHEGVPGERDSSGSSSDRLASVTSVAALSPVRLAVAGPPHQRSAPVTPSKRAAQSAFQVSPSPLKVHRFLSFGNNKMSTLFSDYQIIKEEAKNGFGVEIEGGAAADTGDTAVAAEDAAEEDGAAAPARRRKKTTQKRTTRNWKMKPRVILADAPDIMAGKDVHLELEKLARDEDASVSDDASGSDWDSDEELLKQKEHAAASAVAQKGKIKPLSSNYQRSKINDPRAKAFKRRMKR